MITKEKIIEILHSHSYNVEDQAGNHLIVVDDDSWDAVATEAKNCSISDFSNHVYCPHCGNERERIVETDLNSDRTCMNKLCKGK